VAWITSYGTRVLHEQAARMAIIEECYHGDEVAEYEVYSYSALQHGIEPGDSLLIRNSDLEGYAWVVNLVHGKCALIHWDQLCHAVKPKQRPI
jgi:hypothetical protein